MALLPSIMSLFGSKGADPVTQPNPATMQVAAAQTQSASGNPTVPSPATPQSNGSVPAIPVAGQGDGSPLSNFADLWKTDPNANQQTPSLVPSFNLDPQGLLEAAKKVNFTNHISPELVTKAMSGDQAAFLDVINQAAQLGFANATAASGELVKQSLNSAQGVLTSSVLPSAFRNQAITQALNNSNPVFSDPAVAPLMGMLKQQMQQKYPTSSPDEIATLAGSYLAGMSQKIVSASGGTITPQGQSQGGNRGFGSQPEQDWSKFFDTPN